jgi:hypothetical protein
MKPRGLEIEIQDHHAFAAAGQKPCGMGEKHGPADAPFV